MTLGLPHRSLCADDQISYHCLQNMGFVYYLSPGWAVRKPRTGPAQPRSSAPKATSPPSGSGCILLAAVTPKLQKSLYLCEWADSSTSTARWLIWSRPSHIVQNRQIKQHKPSCNSCVYVDYPGSRLSPVIICFWILAQQFFTSLIKLKAYIHYLWIPWSGP